MTKRTRRNHSPAFKEKVALVALKGEKTLADLAQQFAVDRRSPRNPYGQHAADRESSTGSSMIACRTM